MSQLKPLTALMLIVSAVGLSACGGGGGGGGGDGGTVGSGTTPLPEGDARVEVSWDNPTTRADGTCLGSDLSGFNVAFGNASGHYDWNTQLYLNSGSISCLQIDYDATCGVSVSRCSYTVDGLTAGEWYFAVRAFDSAGISSAYSLEASTQVN